MPPGLSQPAKPDRQVGILATSKARGRCGINTSALSRRLSWVIQFTSIIPSSLACSLASLNRRSTTSKRRASTTVCLCLVPLLCSLSVRTSQPNQNTTTIMPGSTTSSSKLSILKPKPAVVKCGEECDCCGCEEACWCVVQ
ncbi:hypothetical protein IWX49DRAFT_286959 [Phyllosticta citricarpa]